MNQIKDEAREKMARDALAKFLSERYRMGWENSPEDEKEDLREVADQALKLSGETDEETCPDCKGEKILRWKYHGEGVQYPPCKCGRCNGTGTIKKKWHIEIVEG